MGICNARGQPDHFLPPGKKSVLADDLSQLRLVLKETLVAAAHVESTKDPAKSRECNLGEWQRGDPWLGQVIAYIRGDKSALRLK